MCFFLSALGVHAQSGEVYASGLTHEYDGTFKFPLISTDPPGVAVEVKTYPRSQSEIIFESYPLYPQPSYQSYGLHGKIDRALGDVISLGGSNRRLESIDVTMVNWATAAQWPDLASENSAGYSHPLTIFLYSVSGESLTLLGQKTQHFVIPWKPAALTDGGEYPFSGIAFQARFDFVERIELTEQIAVLVTYNTGSSGFAPIGTSGPYDQLNVGLSKIRPTKGTDENRSEVLRFVQHFSPSLAFGRFHPIFTIRAFPDNPVSETPLDSGGYLVEASILDPLHPGSTSRNLEILPLTASVTLTGMKQSANGAPKEPTAQTTPSGLSYETIYANRTGPPTDRGTYAAFVTLNSTNYVGQASGIMRLGHSYDSWIAEQVTSGNIPALQGGKSDDPDFDGFSNLLEYVSATSPGDATSKPPKLLQTVAGEENRLISFTRNHEAIDIEYVLQETNNLNDPASWTAIPLPALLPGDTQTTDLIKIPFPVRPEDKASFVRLGIRIQE